MSYLIDGNNVMAQRVGWHRDKPGARHQLLDDLAQFTLCRPRDPLSERCPIVEYCDYGQSKI